MAPILEVVSVAKSFLIPSVRRDTIREHVFDLFRPRHFERLEVLTDVSFAVEPGETLGIMGRNGCGKSTLLKILCGIYPPDRGEVRRHAAITPILELGVGWNAELNAIDNVYLLGSVMGMSIGEIRCGLDEILAFAELERFANLELKHFSSGMASRLAYAVAFHSAREVLILDEVFAVGDARFMAKCEVRHQELRSRGCTTILVSHNANLVREHCDRAILLSDGVACSFDDASKAADGYLAAATAIPNLTAR